MEVCTARQWGEKWKAKSHTHTLGSTQTISFYCILHTIHPGHDEYAVGIVSFVRWCDAHKSLAWCCTESLAKSLWAQRCPHFWAITYLLELDGSRLTFSLEFKFLILHFCFQFVLQFTWKSKGHPLTLLWSFWVWDLFFTMPYSNRKSRL